MKEAVASAPMVRPALGLDRITVKVSVSSAISSSIAVTVVKTSVCPAVKVSVVAKMVKSVPTGKDNNKCSNYSNKVKSNIQYQWLNQRQQ